jgi:hypothetical protein
MKIRQSVGVVKLTCRQIKFKIFELKVELKSFIEFENPIEKKEFRWT